jgi:hypothetical protein
VARIITLEDEEWQGLQILLNRVDLKGEEAVSYVILINKIQQASIQIGRPERRRAEKAEAKAAKKRTKESPPESLSPPQSE